MKAVCFSDSHMGFPQIPSSKYLLFAGDYQSGRLTEAESEVTARTFLKWMGRQTNEHKVMVPGNHDELFWRDPLLFKSIAKENNIHVLDNEIVQLGKLRIFGSPYFYTCRMNRVLVVDFPDINDFDLMITHVPPQGVMDFNPRSKENIGSPDLRDYVNKNKVRCHIFGHCHEGHCSANPFHNVALACGGRTKTIVNKVKEMEVNYLCN